MSFVSYQFRIYQNTFQRQSLIDHFGCTRWVYNRYLSEAPDGHSLIERIESRNGERILEHAEKIGFGDRRYRLVCID